MGRCLSCLIIACLSLFIWCIDANAETTTSRIFYVDNNGNDENSGTIHEPWKTIQKAADNTAPGDLVYVRGGTYPELVSIKNSGSAEDGYITFKAYPGETPVMDMNEQVIKKGNSAFFTINANYIVIDGFEMKNLITNGPEYYPNGILVMNQSNHIRLVQNDIHHIENHSKKGNAHGILIYGNASDPISDITIKDNNIHHLILGNSEALTLNGNVEKFTISDNVVHDNNNIGIDIAGFYGTCTGCIDQARNGTIKNNRVYLNSSKKNPSYAGHYAAGGIYVDGGKAVKILNNIVYKNDFGIELASERKGKTTSSVTVKNNNIFNNNGAGLLLGGAYTSNGGASKNIITNNAFSLNDIKHQGYGEITFQKYAKKNQIIDNKFYIKKKSTSIYPVPKKNPENTFKNNKTYFEFSIFPTYEYLSLSF